MKRIHVILSAVLGVQVLLGVATWWPEAGPTPAHALVDLPKDQVTELLVEKKPVEGQTAEPVRLVKEGGSWVVASAANYPADPAKVEEVVGYLADLQVRDPVATKALSHAALKVGDVEYGRKVHIAGGGRSYDLLLGAAAGKAVNLRLAGSDDVYLVRGFSELSVKDKGNAYWNQDLVKVDKALVAGFTVRNATGAFSLEKQGDVWAASGLPEGKALDEAAIDKLLGTLARLRIKEPVGTAMDPAYGFDTGTRVSWSMTQEDSLVEGGLSLGAEVDGTVYARVDGNPFVVKVPTAAVKALNEATLQGLLK